MFGLKNKENKVVKWFKTNAKTIAVVLVALFIIFSVFTCEQQRKSVRTLENSLEFLNDSLEIFKNKEGKWQASKAALRGENDKLSKKNQSLNLLLSKQIDSTRQLTKLVENFKTVNSAGNITTETKIEEVFIPFNEPVETNFFRSWKKENDFYRILGETNQDGTTLKEIYLPTLISFSLGEKKVGWFKTKYSFDAVSSNPHVRITGLDGGTFEDKNSRLGISVFTGYALGKNLQFTPVIGGGLSYTIIYF